MKNRKGSSQITDNHEAAQGTDAAQQSRYAAGPNDAASPAVSSEDLLVAALRHLPQLEPPAALLPRVMQGVRSMRLPWWRRLLRWARTPRSLTVVPLRLVPAAAALAVMAVMAFHWQSMDRSRLLVAPDRVTHIPVALTLQLSGAHSVAVIGNFNEWHPNGFEMHRNDRSQPWSIQLQLPPGRYEYSFLVDGQKIIADPQAPFYQDDGFGNQNGVLIVGNSHEAKI
jgi:hypothetical protein